MANGLGISERPLLSWATVRLCAGARTARTAFHEGCSGFGGFFRSLTNETKPFSGYLTVIPAVDANLWFTLIDLTERPGAEINRLALLDAGLGNDVIDRLLDENWPGYQNVAIPHAAKVPVADLPLKRQASVDALKKQVPPPAIGDRRFFRTCLRIVKA